MLLAALKKYNKVNKHRLHSAFSKLTSTSSWVYMIMRMKVTTAGAHMTNIDFRAVNNIYQKKIKG